MTPRGALTLHSGVVRPVLAARTAAALLFLSAPAAITAANLTWTGAFNGNWAFFGGFPVSNWGGLLPSDDDVLTFPSTGANRSMTNTFPEDHEFHRLRFTDDGYSLAGTQLTFYPDSNSAAPEVRISHGAGTTVISAPLSSSSQSEVDMIVSNASATLRLENELLGLWDILGAGRVEWEGDNTMRSMAIRVGSGTDSPTLSVLNMQMNSLQVRNGATLRGFARVAGDMTMAGRCAPGDAVAGFSALGQVTVDFDLFLSSTAILEMEVQSAAAFDSIQAGTVTCGSAVVDLVPLQSVPANTVFKLINNTGTGAIDSTPPFRLASGAQITEGLEVNIGVNRWRFSYTGGDGNDFTVTSLVPAFSGVREWDAGGSTRLMSEAANWTSNTLPVATNTLRFGSLAPAVPLGERFPVNDVGGTYYSLDFTSGGYSLEEDDTSGNLPQNDLTLSAGITANHTSDGLAFEQDIILAAPQTFSLTGASFMRFGVNHQIRLGANTLTLRNTNTAEMRFNGPITGTGGLIKTGSGLLTMGGAGAGSFTGGTQVHEGELRLSRSSPNGGVPGALTVGGAGFAAKTVITLAQQIADTATVTLRDRGVLRLDAAETITGLALEGGDTEGASLLTLTGDVTASADAFLRAPLHFNNAGGPRTWHTGEGATIFVMGALTDSGSAAGITQVKTGAGMLVLDSTAADTHVQLVDGTLDLSGSTGSSAAAPTVTLAGGTLGGEGFAHNVQGTAGIPGDIHPGLGGVNHASLTCARLNLVAANSITIGLSRAGTAGVDYDTIAVAAGTSTGQVTLGNTRLRLNQTAALAVGTLFLIVDNDGTDTVSGTFAGLAQGARISTPFNTFTISYTGGTGNDITLTATAAPEISVERGAPLLTGAAHQLPATSTGSSTEATFTVRNTGTAALTLSGSPRVQISGTHAPHFTITQQPASSVPINSTTTFTLRYTPTVPGPHTATLTIPNNDHDEAPFTIPLTALALPSPRVTSITATRGTPTLPGTVSLTATGFNPGASVTIQASGNLLTWTNLRTLTTDDLGSLTTGTLNDPASTGQTRRYYRATQP